MGHAINYNVFSTKESKDNIFAEVNSVAIEDGDYHQSIGAITWYDKCFNSYEDAEKFIKEHDGFYSQIAVKFKKDKNFKPSKTLEVLKEKCKDANKAYNKQWNAFHFANHKSETVGCKHCGSKIALKYLKSNICPVCKKDLRPKSTLERIEQLKEKSNELQAKCKEKEKEERLKGIKNAAEYWLVKTEYHV